MDTLKRFTHDLFVFYNVDEREYRGAVKDKTGIVNNMMINLNDTEEEKFIREYVS